MLPDWYKRIVKYLDKTVMWVLILIVSVILIWKFGFKGRNTSRKTYTSTGRNMNRDAAIMDSVSKIAANSTTKNGFYWANFRTRKPQTAVEIEKLLEKDMASLSDIDAFQLVTMLLRVSANSGLPIMELKNSVTEQLFNACESLADLEMIISRLKNEKINEAATFHINKDNTYSNLILEWAIEFKHKMLENKILKDWVMELGLDKNSIEQFESDCHRIGEELNIAPDISQFDREENRLIALAERGVEYINDTFRPLCNDGWSEALIFCTTCLIDLPTDYGNTLDMDKKEDRYYLLLHDKIIPDSSDFINSRIKFYNEEKAKMKIQPNYTPMFIYNAFYMNPMCDEPGVVTEFEESPLELLMFSGVLTKLQQFIAEEKNKI